MDKITYLELLKRVDEQRPPKRIRMFDNTYTWDGADYAWDIIHAITLTNHLKEWTMIAQAKTEVIEVIE